MRNPFKKKRGPVAGHRNNVDTEGSRWGSKSGRPIGDSDRLVPSSFSTPIELPDPAQVHAALYAFIDAAAARGALDAGTYDFADQWVGTRVNGWLAQLHDEHRLRVDSAAQIVSGRTENLSVSWSTLLETEGRLGELDESIADYVTQLRGGDAEQPASSARPTTERVQERLHSLPTATQLAGLTAIDN